VAGPCIYIVFMCRDNSWYGCGASILSCDPVLIITAAHCVYNRFADENNINGEIKVKKNYNWCQ